MRTDILGVGLDDLTVQSAAEYALELMSERRGAYVCTPNPEMLWLASRDAELKDILNRADLVLPDGVGDLLAAKMLKRPLTERVSGFDFCCELLSRTEGSVFLLGAKPGVAERAAGVLVRRWPKLHMAGTQDGYYSDEASVKETILRAAPDILLVCLGMGRQERFMASLAGREEIGLMAGLGGTLDVLSGDVRRAPEFFIRNRIEWLYRIVTQPSRWKRFLRLPRFLAAVVKQKVKEKWAKEN